VFTILQLQGVLASMHLLLLPSCLCRQDLMEVDCGSLRSLMLLLVFHALASKLLYSLLLVPRQAFLYLGGSSCSAAA
jgi:hypothetical protein